MHNSNLEKNIHKFSQKNVRYFRKATNALHPRSRSSSNKSKKDMKVDKSKKESKVFAKHVEFI